MMYVDDMGSRRMRRISKTVKKLQNILIDIRYLEKPDLYPNMQQIQQFVRGVQNLIGNVKYSSVQTWPTEAFSAMDALKKQANDLEDMEVNELEEEYVISALEAFRHFVNVDYNRLNQKRRCRCI